MSSMMESYREGSQLELIGAQFAGKNTPTMPDLGALLGEGSREQQSENLKTAVLGKVREALNLLWSKATPEGGGGLQKMIATVAEETAKEGGFLALAACGERRPSRPSRTR